MREATAKSAAMASGAAVSIAVVVFALLQQQSGRSALTGSGEDPPPAAAAVNENQDAANGEHAPPVDDAESPLVLGRRVYDEQGCAACHSIAGTGSPRSPLDGVGARLDEARIRLWIVDPQAARPGIRKPAFDDLPADELDALVAFMQSLR